jgi:hypothetical protein
MRAKDLGLVDVLAAAAVPLALALGLSACEKDKTTAPQPARQSPLQRDGTAARAVTASLDRIRVATDLGAVRAALRAWHSQHGRYPARIEDLKLEGLKYPTDLVYDSSKGTVKSATYPGL